MKRARATRGAQRSGRKAELAAAAEAAVAEAAAVVAEAVVAEAAVEAVVQAARPSLCQSHCQ